MPLSFKIGAGILASLLFIWGVAAAVAPSFVDPNKALSRVAKRVAAGPKNPNDARQALTELDDAVRNFLKQNGNLPAAALTKKLQEPLSESAFEIHVFDLPRGLTVVEIDTVLQASDYLIQKSNSGVKVTSLPGMEVFDAAKIIDDNAAPVLVLVGHTAGQGAHRPLIRAFALLPDDTVDQTAKSVPDVKTEGVAAFAKNGKDINVDYSLFSLAGAEKIFDPSSKLPAGLPDESIHGNWRWGDGHYEASRSIGNGQLSALYAVAKSIYSPADASHFANILGQSGLALVNGKKSDKAATAPLFVIARQGEPAVSSSGRSRRHAKQAAVQKASYTLTSKDSSYLIELTAAGGANWTVAHAGQTSGATENQALSATPPAINDSGQPKTDGVASLINGQKPNFGEQSEKPAENAKEETKTTDIGSEQSKEQPGGTESGAPNENNEKASRTAESEDHQTGVAASVAKEIDTTKVRLRSGPGPNFNQIAQISRGAKITVIGKTNGWYKIKVNGQQGYIYGGLVDYKTPDAYETITVRKAEGLTDEHEHSVGSSRPGDRLVVLGGAKEGKLKVQLASGKTAFINKDAVDVSQDTPQFVP